MSRMRHSIRSASALLLVALLSLALATATASSGVEIDVEGIYLAGPSAAQARQNLEFYTSIDHVAGTAGDYNTAVFTQQRLQALGLQAEILPFQTGLNYPISRSLEMIYPTSYTPGLSEPIVPEDPTSDNHWRNMSFNGYGASGDVTGELVYVNYGSYDDFQQLASMGISVTGKIVIVRYGHIFRGLKVKNAQEAGAIGCLIYSDPIDDGYDKGPVYPQGRWRPEFGIQRGSVQFLSICSGDPFMVERDPDICGYPTDELIPRIPSLPLSYGDAMPLLQAISSTPAPQSWIGGLNITYNIGPGPAQVHLIVSMNYSTQTLWNVECTIPGTHPDPEVASQLVLLGNHRDAWVLGSTDPNSGTVALLEVAHGLSNLLAAGWTPDRTIKLLSWDGEEYGLLGSTNYGETYAKNLTDKAIIYMNVDVAVTGSDYIIALTPSLGAFLSNATHSIIDPNTNNTLYNVWDKYIGRLGSGTDFAVMLHHLGISSMDMGFRDHDSGAYGVYHSVYDSFYWTCNFGDPTFGYHRAMAQLWGLLAIRMADARVLPFNFTDFATQLVEYQTEAQNYAKNKSMPLEFISLTAAINTSYVPAAAALDCYSAYVMSNSSIPQAELNALNVNLYTMERGFLDMKGLPHRPWFRHVIQAPGLQYGYDSSAFPGLLDSIDAGDRTGAQDQIEIIAGIIAGVGYNMWESVPYSAPGC